MLVFITLIGKMIASYFVLQKQTDQTGRNKDQVWHVYATPNNPTTCPVLAFACYIFSNPGITNRHNLNESDEVMLDKVGHEGNLAGCIFPREQQYDWFMECLCQIIELHHLGGGCF